MRESERIEQFNQDLDQMIVHHGDISDSQQDTLYQEMLEIGSHLHNTQLATLSTNKDSLRQQLLKKRPSTQRTSRKTVTLAFASFLIVITVLLLLSPPLQTWAQELLARIGGMNITNAPTFIERHPDGFEGIPLEEAGIDYWEVTSQAEATELAGFHVFFPQYLPSNQTHQQTMIAKFEGDTLVSSDFSGTYILAITQRPFTQDPEIDYPVGDAQVIEVQLRNKTGYFATNVKNSIMNYMNSDGMIEGELGSNNLLFWGEDEFIFLIGSDELSLDQLLKIAESMQ